MQCSICYTNENLVYTACNHKFCEFCLKSWLEIKHNCPVCRRSVFDYRKCIAINKKIDKNNKKITRSKRKSIPYVREIPVKTRSKTRTRRINDLSQYMETSYNIMNNMNNDNIHEKIKKIEEIFKKITSNLCLIRRIDQTCIHSIENLIQQLEHNSNIINHNYLDKVKLWKFKIRNI